MKVLAFIDDLLFQSKVRVAAEETGAELTFERISTEVEFLCSEASWNLVIVDLGFRASDPLDLVATIRRALPATPIIGFCAHVQTALQAAAEAAGCNEVLPRSAFVERLPDLMHGLP